jgi:hypothetical protein
MSGDEDFKKIDQKKHKKHAQFLLYSFCHYILEIYNRLADKPEINFIILIPLVNNYILNLFTICLANQINLDTAKGLIDEAVIIVLDYISISNEEEFQKQNYNSRFNDAIFFSWQKIHDRILRLIPNKPFASIINNLPQGLLLGMSPQSLPSNLAHIISPSIGNNQLGHMGTTKSSIKRRLPTPGTATNLSNNINIIGCSINRTSKSIILTCEIITHIFNLFAGVYPLRLSDTISTGLLAQSGATSFSLNSSPSRVGLELSGNGTTQNNWLEIFEPINTNILSDDTHEDDVQYSNSVVFTRLTYNLDIMECFINMLLPQILKISQSVISTANLDMLIGQRIAASINQIYSRLSAVSGINIPSFIYLTIIYNYLHNPIENIIDATTQLFTVGRCCSTGIYLGICAISNNNNNINLGTNKYYLALEKLKSVLGQTHNQSGTSINKTIKNNMVAGNLNNNPSNPTNLNSNCNKKKINNRNLITAIITLNNQITD